jgi:iron complex outermembrane receptor protein
MSNTSIKLLAICIAATASAGHAEPASTLQEIIVTAQKQSQDIERVPASVTVISADDMQLLGAQNLDDISRWTPGTYFQSQSVTQPGYAIRGITSDSGSPLLQPRVSIYQNGVDISSHRGANTALYDLEQIEILKGPQGTLFGRAAETGAVNIRQQLPKNETAGQVQAGLGSLNEKFFNASYNTPLVEDKALVRVAVYERQRDGYVDNRAGGDLGSINTQAIRPSISFIGENQSLDLIANYQKDQPSGTPFESVYFAVDAPEHANLEQGKQLGTDRELWDVTAHYQHELVNNWTLHSISAYREYSAYEHFDADGSQYRLLDMEDIADHHQFSEELRWQLDGEKWDGFFGASMFTENSERESTNAYDEGLLLKLPIVRNTVFGVPFSSALLLTPPNLDTRLPLKPLVYESQQQKTDNTSGDIFSDWTWHWTDKLDVIGGIRATYEDVESAQYSPSPATATAPTFGGTGGMFFPGARNEYNAADHFWGWSGRLFANYKLTTDTSIYGGYSRGRRPDMLTFNYVKATNTFKPDQLKDETVDSYETGIKWQSPDQRQRMQVSVFHYQYNNFLTVYPDTSSNGNPLLMKSDDNGTASSNGVEWQGDTLLSDNWRVLGNLAYLDARIDDEDKYQFAGNRFRLAPEWTGAVAVVYSKPVNGYEIFAAPNYTFQSRVYFEDDNSSNFGNNKQDGYGLFNLHLGVIPAHKNWQADFYIDNALDREYLIDSGNFGGVLGMATTVPGAPRTARLAGTWKF